jgi:peptidoglycan lytic transglycosylase B
MIERRHLIAAASLSAAIPTRKAFTRPKHAPARADAPQGSYASFLAGVREKGAQNGVSSRVLDVALALRQPNSRVLELDRHQPEFTLSWAQYRQHVVTNTRVHAARKAYQDRLGFLTSLWTRYGVDPRIIVGIWGLESDFGNRVGSFGVVDSLATLAFNGRRPAFFYAELMTALRILQCGDVATDRMLGSYAGAMGQPQFMPSAYWSYAVDYDGDGRRDIWSSETDALASIANYLMQKGWSRGAPWGQPVSVPRDLDPSKTGRHTRRALSAWMELGVRRLDETPFTRTDVSGALLLPDGVGGDAFMVYDNFEVIRRYNASDSYALAVGLVGSATA